ncbi:MAG TPA: hypothetical protein V6C95_06435 [Coleofasciculaceae cyanobacterium]
MLKKALKQDEQPRLSLLGWQEVRLKSPCACGYEYSWAVPRPDTVHHAALHCQNCDQLRWCASRNRFNGWQSKPQGQGGVR